MFNLNKKHSKAVGKWVLVMLTVAAMVFTLAIPILST